MLCAHRLWKIRGNISDDNADGDDGSVGCGMDSGGGGD